MERFDSEEPGGKTTASTDTTATSTRPTAIERQIAAAASRPQINSHASPSTPRYVASGNLLVLFLLVATGLVFVFSDSGRPLRTNISSAWRAIAQTTHIPSTSPAKAAPPPTPEKVAKISTQPTLSIPITDVTLRDRPELLEELVRVYRAQLADHPDDPAALATLDRLRKRSLSELEAIVAAGNDTTAVRSFDVASRLFPELTDNPRYKSLSTRMNQSHRAAETAPSIEPAQHEPMHTSMQAPGQPAPHAPSTAIASSRQAASPLAAPSALVAKKSVQDILPSRPEIHVISITPGTMVAQRFVASADGNLLMVEISYRHFENKSADQSDVTVTARLGIAGEPQVLAEVPVVIEGDRGTKDFVMEPLLRGNSDEKYQLNFILNNEFLTSRTTRVSIPAP